MSVKASVSLSPQQEEFVRKLVEEGHYPSLSAVVERGLQLVREETEMKEEELAVLKALLDRRRQGEFLSEAESRKRIDAMIAAKKAQYGL